MLSRFDYGTSCGTFSKAAVANESTDCRQIRLCSDKDAKGLIHRVDYDDPQSLKLKYGYAKQAQALGVGMWTASSIDCAKRLQPAVH